MINLSFIGHSLGCSASGERLVSASKDGDLQEAKALLDHNPRLASYSTFGFRNSPLHFSAAQGHHEVVALLLESGVDVNLRNARGLTGLMLACQYGHWEVVQTLMLFKANILKKDYLHGGTALHLASLNGHTRCIRLLLADYVPSIVEFWHIMSGSIEASVTDNFDLYELSKVINGRADGGITALHLAALNGHAESVQLLLDLGASVSELTLNDGAIIDLVGAGSTPLHYAACGGNAACCQVLIARGANLSAKNANRATPLMVARSWRRNWLENILSDENQCRIRVLPSPCLSLPLMSIFKIARDCGWRNNFSQSPACMDPCVVCLEGKCTVYAEGCGHEFCTKCALYLCSTNQTTTVIQGPPGCIACPLCRKAIVVFVKLDIAKLGKELTKMSLLSSTCSTDIEYRNSITARSHKSNRHFACIPLLASSSLRFLGFERLPSLKLNSVLCKGNPDKIHSLVRNRRLQQSTSHIKRHKKSFSWFVNLNKYVTACGSN
ncbi:probable E3 ubiquitin-protein ligase XBOS32 isoform X1 [Dendrobium catenatum]|uniref:RING-type E3 ubiquitin transferase n=1 Tax=Dendrobium catenatum TaxID=906689 RepID=A0A2I0WE62_9ASPA|nr:probable E3 ubiquitin-protein ligase XBOS32 isoform X1 [Dendrobium catenatum]PKU73945.1 putative E3 ubiquitin-protein ligase XBOS32 [Dendrobium catenatum]